MEMVVRVLLLIGLAITIALMLCALFIAAEYIYSRIACAKRLQKVDKLVEIKMKKLEQDIKEEK